MHSAIVFVGESDVEASGFDVPVALSRSLAALVEAALAGALRDVIIAGPRRQGLDLIADHAGCSFVESEREVEWLAQALDRAEGPGCLILKAGYAPGPGFLDELRHLRRGPPPIAGVYRAEPRHWTAQLLPRLAPIAAAIAPLEAWRDGPAQRFEGKARRLKGLTLQTRMQRIG